MKVEWVMLLHGIVMSVVLIMCLRILIKRGLFRWMTAGFWSFVALFLYFVLSPISSVITGKTDKWNYIMAISGGTNHAIWILIACIVGTVIFFYAYLNTNTKHIKGSLFLRKYEINPIGTLILVLFIVIGFYGLLTFRSNLIFHKEIIVEGGRYVGEVTGYQNIAYVFLFVPMVFLILGKYRFGKVIGNIIGISIFIFSLPNAFGRYITVSLIITWSLLNVYLNNRRWPRAWHIVAIILVAGALQLRGHTEWKFSDIFANSEVILPQIVTKNIEIISKNDTSMLASWWAGSYLTDRYIGYNYGLEFLNYLITGWIPNRFFPNKYFIIDWLREYKGENYPIMYDYILSGAKFTIIGDFYNWGGVIGIIGTMYILGFLFRKLDGMLLSNYPTIINAVGICWLGQLWMVWGSHAFWGLISLGTISIPAIMLWFCYPKAKIKITKIRT